MSEWIHVIVPVYGVEQYLETCIDSILAQTYQKFRLILVDDGSPDGCPQICDRYQAMDDRITVIHRENGGQSAARNSGLTFLQNGGLSEEDYVAFVDSDDTVAPDYLEFLHRLITEYHADIAQCGHYVVFSQKRKIDKNKDHQTRVLSRAEALESLCYNGIWDVTVWNKLYRLSVFSDIRFPEGRLYEDTAVAPLLVSKADRLVVNMEPKYYYMQRYTSTANGLLWNDYKYQFLQAGDELADFVTAQEPRLADAANVKRVFVRLSTLSQMVNCNHYDRKRIAELKRAIAHDRWSVLKNPKAAKRDKLGVMAIWLGYPFYWCIWKLYYRIVRRR